MLAVLQDVPGLLLEEELLEVMLCMLRLPGLELVISDMLLPNCGWTVQDVLGLLLPKEEELPELLSMLLCMLCLLSMLRLPGVLLGMGRPVRLAVCCNFCCCRYSSLHCSNTAHQFDSAVHQLKGVAKSCFWDAIAHEFVISVAM